MSKANGVPHDPVDHPEVYLTCNSNTLKYGALTKYTYCFYACVSDPLCEWVEYDTITKNCKGGQQVCGTQNLISTVNKKRLGIKLRTEVVTHNGAQIAGATFLSATSHVYRPYTSPNTGISCMLEETSSSISACTWSKVSGMELVSYQHVSTGTGNIYELQNIGITSSSYFSGTSFDSYVCPELNSGGRSWPISVNDESLSMKTASCASYLSNDIQSYFAVLIYDSTASPPGGFGHCYLLATCGSSVNPMVSYSDTFGSSLDSSTEVVIMAKEATILPINVDSATGPKTLATAATSANATIYQDFLQRGSAANTYVSAAHHCLTNHHGYYDSGQLAISSVCVPSSCSIWGTTPGYRDQIRFFEDTCEASGEAPQCCANETLVPTLELCSATVDDNAQCVTKITGTAASVGYNEIEYIPNMANFVLPDAALHQSKRAESDLLKDGDQKLTPTCTYKVDVYCESSYSLGPQSVVLRAGEELSTSYSTHVSKACSQVEGDPRLNELVVTRGKQSTHVSREDTAYEKLRVIARSPMAPYGDLAKAPVPMTSALDNFQNMADDTTERGTGFYDARRPTELEWIKNATDQKYAGFVLPNTQSNEDGSTVGQVLKSASAEKSTVFLNAQMDGVPKSGTSRVVARRSIRTTEETVSVCLNLCEKDARFSITAFDKTDFGSDTVYFGSDTLAAHVGDTASIRVKVNGVTYYAPPANSLLSDFSSMHNVTEEDLVVVELRELDSSQDHRRVTYRTLDRQNALRLGGVCIHDLALISNKSYEISAQYGKSGSYSLDSLCSEHQAGSQDVATVNYLTSVLQNTQPIVTSRYPPFRYLQEDPDDWVLRYHNASQFAVSNPDSTYDGYFDEELRAVEKVATTSHQLNILLHRLCDDVTVASSDADYDLPIAACLGFTYRMRMNPTKKIQEGTLLTYGDFCYNDKPSLFTSKADCETRYTGGCEASSVVTYPMYDGFGNLEDVSVPVGSERLYQPADSSVVDLMETAGRLGGTARSTCGTYRDRMIDFYEAKLFVSYPVTAEVRTEMADKNVTLDSTLDEVRAKEITRKTIESTDYQVSLKEVADSAALDRVTFLRESMYGVVVNKLSESMRNTSIFVHTDKITAQAFDCGVPLLTSTHIQDTGVFTDLYTLSFMWNNVLKVNGEDVVDNELSFAWGKTQADAMTEILQSQPRTFSFPSKCTSAEADPSSFESYMKVSRVCSTDVSMTWQTNPENVTYATDRNASLSNPNCEAQSMEIQFNGQLSDFLDLTSTTTPYHINRQDYAGAYTHKTQLLLREKLHLRSGNTVERDIFYPVIIKTFSLRVMTFSAQAAVVPPAISQLLDVTVQYDHSTYSSVVELSTRMCVSQPLNTSSEFKYTLVDPITNYDAARTNPSFDPEVRALGKPVYGKLADGSSSVPGAMGDLYILNADDSSFDSTVFEGLNDVRFDQIEAISCRLLRQNTGDEAIPGTDPRFTSDDNANEYFEFNCFDRLYACDFDNVDQWENLHIRFGTTFVVKSGGLFTIDPLDPQDASHFATISVTTTAKSTTQNFDVTMSIDVPASLQNGTDMPTWSEYHAQDSDGISTLRAIVDGTGTAATRIEREQRFRLTTFFSDVNIRRQYVLYPMSLFAILKLKDAESGNSQSSGKLESTGGSIQGTKTDLCGITPSMITDLDSFDKLGKLVPIYQGLFQDGLSATDNSFVNPSTMSLSEFFNYGSVSPQIRDVMQSSQIYVSESLREDLFPVHEKGGMDLETSALSWQMFNNIVLDSTSADATFELTFCFLGAVATKFDSGYDTAKLLYETRYQEFTASTCESFSERSTSYSWIGSISESTKPFGCYAITDQTTGSWSQIGFNPSTEILTSTGLGDRTYLCPDSNLVYGLDYRARLLSLTCGQVVYSEQLSSARCDSLYGASNYLGIVNDANKPSGCIYEPGTTGAAATYSYNQAITTIQCQPQARCECERVKTANTFQIVSVRGGVCSVSADNLESDRRKLLGYTTGKLSIGSRSTDTDAQPSGNVENAHLVELAASSRSSSTDSSATDGSTSSTTDITVTTNIDTDDEHDDHDSKKLKTILIVALTFCCVVFLVLVLKLASVASRVHQVLTGTIPHWVLKERARRVSGKRQTTRHRKDPSYLRI
ncbi:hypothetical protein CYMTET_8410 [Cymbomonas tetramitiformis]|uniref:Uncharacterized protein n=1 Tax=Cymbomonas tetramitiformis TaxID=36881 RepID=A0AAE0LG41_9CHLO|nr:hypothetical protein CYMTET_8410 [Cymbomonas tetramitiformis]